MLYSHSLRAHFGRLLLMKQLQHVACITILWLPIYLFLLHQVLILCGTHGCLAGGCYCRQHRYCKSNCHWHQFVNKIGSTENSNNNNSAGNL